MFSGNINYNTLKDSPARKKVGPNQLYYQSKFVREFRGGPHHSSI
jgi:hypothetical protein